MQEVVDSFKELYLNNIGISLYSLEESVHEQITGAEGSYKKTKHSIEELVKSNVGVTIKTPIFNINYKEIDNFVEYSRRIGCSVQFSPIILPKMNGDNNNVLNYSISQDTLNDLIDNVHVFASNSAEKTVNSFEDNSTFCSALHCGGYIDAEGNVYPCNQLPYLLGNVQEQPFSQIWNSSLQINNIREMKNIDLTECHKCDLKEHCTRCPGHAMYESNDILGCSMSAKKIAIARKNKMLYSSVSEIYY